MKFGKYLNRVVSPMFCEGQVKEPMIKYKILKKYIAMIICHPGECVSNTLASDKCNICCEPWTLGPGIITSKCKHSFHPTCILNYLNSIETNKSCPVCGSSVKDFMPNGFDGAVLQFLAMIRLNINAVEQNHALHVRELQRKLSTIRHLIDTGKLTTNATNHTFQRQLHTEIANLGRMLLYQLKLAHFYGWICYEAVRKIVKKFDKHTMLDISSGFLQSVQALQFYRNCCRPCLGTLSEMRQDLLDLLAVRADRVDFTSAPLELPASPKAEEAPESPAAHYEASTDEIPVDWLDGLSPSSPGACGELALAEVAFS